MEAHRRSKPRVSPPSGTPLILRRVCRSALCIIVDDMIDTGDTLGNAVRLLKGAGARKIIAFATHGRFSGAGEARIAEIPGLERLVICNTLPHRCVTACLVVAYDSTASQGRKQLP